MIDHFFLSELRSEFLNIKVNFKDTFIMTCVKNKCAEIQNIKKQL